MKMCENTMTPGFLGTRPGIPSGRFIT